MRDAACERDNSARVRRWFSVHLYMPEARPIYSRSFDAFVLACTARVRKHAHEYRTAPMFFVRYSDPSPHVRLRLLVPTHIRDDEVIAALGLGGAAGNDEVGRVAVCPYAPEYGRYGGAIGVACAEAGFCSSSRDAIAQLKRLTGRPREATLGAALVTTYLALHVACGDRALIRTLAQRICDDWLRTNESQSERAPWRAAFAVACDEQRDAVRAHLQLLARTLDTGAVLPSALARARVNWQAVVAAYLRAARQRELHAAPNRILTWHDARAGIMSSLLHMNHNRIGLSRAEEAYIWYLVAEANGCDVRPSGIGESGDA